ncbi:MAG: neutral zinc metallopeptidase [Ornithinimicrobium sp.]|uniref:KPN_02809 family neutral zinc metallopeptidase n=1 Tax=Ornithinimicrobium sp. TaxID=1977084 RepID=UPI0026E1061F|nr:neutral zinc metallopeptidase [Ornithinimicrobium sp.]MDO5738654.1 neutral zinc metallopeptidase [Ornithinimicrobium sp.]
MTFRENANIGSGRARGGGGGGGLAVGGGIGALLLALVVLLLGGDPGAILGGGQQTESQAENVDLAQCQTGADANARVDCRMKATMLSLEDYWAETYPKAKPTEAILFSGAVSTQCGQATSQVGPFYCPLDQKIYLDTSFFDQLEGQLGADGGNFSQMYVLAHEYGHHIQNYTGALQSSQQDPKGPESGAVRVELQADCFAGAWAGNAATTKDPDGNTLLEPLTEEDVNSAISAASAVGDDSIQEKMQGQVTPHNWTHGSAEQRVGWFMKGYKTGDANQCNTLQAASVDDF